MGIGDWAQSPNPQTPNPKPQPPKIKKKNLKGVYKKKTRIRAQSANAFGKRSIKKEEKIVTEDYLIMMKEFKAIKSNINPKLKNNKSSANMLINQIASNTDGTVNNSTSQNIILNTSSQHSIQKNCNKNFRYQLSFEEWSAVKAKQSEIAKKVKIIKESEDQNFEFFNKKIDDNYKIIQ